MVDGKFKSIYIYFFDNQVLSFPFTAQLPSSFCPGFLDGEWGRVQETAFDYRFLFWLFFVVVFYFFLFNSFVEV